MNKDAAHTAPHILPLKLYLGVGAALIVLTAITVTVSFFNFGPYNLVVAMIVAATKASLVALFFMHLKYDNKIYLVIFLTSVVFLAVFIILTMFDTLRRDDIDEMKAEPIRPEAIIYDSLKTPKHDTADSTFNVPDTTE